MKTQLEMWPGDHRSLGAHYDGGGTFFRLYAPEADSVELCLFDSAGDESETHRLNVRDRTAGIFHCYVPGIGPGQLYGYRVHGRYEPGSGFRFNPHKVLLDPYARAIGRTSVLADSLFGYELGNREEDLSFDSRDNADVCELGEVVDTSFQWGDDAPPRSEADKWSDALLYEVHVRGFTKLHREIPRELRGTYAGLASDPVLRYLESLRVTAVQLLPIFHGFVDRNLIARGSTDYWNYNPVAYFAPTPRYAAAKDGQSTVREVKEMIRKLHRAGIEVILDVVYNHTGEGNQLGPTLSFRGIANRQYYHLERGRYYWDASGCGNTLNLEHPMVLRMVMDSLRYWVQEFHVDGFRFDLASALCREGRHFNPSSAFLKVVGQDPVLSRVKLIAEPWDVAMGGYHLGEFPAGWSEWNQEYRTTVRRFFRGDSGMLGRMAGALTGSAHLFNPNFRRPYASINYIGTHDGFTLADLVSYHDKRNAANGENNADGQNDNFSVDYGVEGPTSDPEIIRKRVLHARNLMAALLLSAGVPMLNGGDEFFRTQGGNNNPYCQDNETTWFDWDWAPHQREFFEFVKQLIEVRRSQPALQRRRFFRGLETSPDDPDILWLTPERRVMTAGDWSESARTLGICFFGHAIGEKDPRGRPIEGSTILVLLNGEDSEVSFVLPDGEFQKDPDKATWWTLIADTALESPFPRKHVRRRRGGKPVIVRPRSVVLFAKH